ncbi:MAG TPA: glutathione peroxidase [Fimbriimonadaceae bacterium]|nr:glutathione peroxidase [Fimbriimonadaceae bacterium]
MVATLLAAFCLTTPVSPANTLYEFTKKDIDGKERKLADFKGKVVLVVNVASKCGLTKQYAGIEALYRKYKSKGLVVLGFPANNFGGQEPGTEAEIKQFCTGTYDVTFPMFSKISVKGDDIDPLFTWLIAQSGRKEDIEWNFAKFVVAKDGKRVLRFSPRTTPESPEFVQALEQELGK